MRVVRLILALIAATLFGATSFAGGATAQTPARDWRTAVVQAPSGAFLIGNPAAKVKLVEYLSYTCPHCAHFIAESKAPLKDDLVRRGVVRIEYRHAVRDPLDMAAALLARCSGPREFMGASEAIFAAQGSWYAKGAQWWRTNAAALEQFGELDRLKAAAMASGLTELMRKRGMSQAHADKCFANGTDLATLTAMSDTAWKAIDGTPSFVVNGKPGGGAAWSTLAPELRAAGAQ